jgi:putative ABC transport system permease protein
MMRSFLQDVRYGARMLLKNPGFAVVAILTLALGIGANTAIFSVVQQVLLRPLPYQNPEGLVQVWNTYPPAWTQLGLSPGDFEDWRREAQSFSEVAAYVDVSQGFNMTGQGDPERLVASYATSGLFPMLGVHPVIGRTFSAEQDKPGSAPAVLISHTLWQSRFGSDPGVVGRTIMLDGRGHTLAGVLPANFRLVPEADLWMPVGQYSDDLTGRIHHPFSVIARLKPEVTVSQAQAEVVTLNRRSELAFPSTHKNWGVTVQRMEDPAASKLRMALLLLSGAVGLVLLIACANIMNLLLARNAARRKEIALRVALGADRLRLVSQLLTESVLLSLLGGTLGIFLASAGLSALDSLVPSGLDGVKVTGLNGWVLGFTIAVCFLTGILCGLVPALQTLKADLHGVLKEGTRSSVASTGQRIRSALVVSEIALSLIPLIGAGLLLKSFHRLLGVNPGFQPDHVLTMKVTQPELPSEVLDRMTPEQLQQLSRKQALQFEQIAERIRSLPGVKNVGGITVLPLASSLVSASRFVVEGQPVPEAGTRQFAEVRSASLRYFDAMEIPLLKGRLLDEGDWVESNIVINESMARRFWPGGDALGKRINLCSLDPQPCWSSVVGVVGDVREYGLDGATTLDVYGSGGWTPYLVIRTANDPSAVAHAAIEEIHKTDPALPVTRVMTLSALLSDSVSSRRFSTVLLGIFAVLALALAAVGIYGVMSYVVSLRANEIAIRMALGAQPREIWSLVLGRGTKLAIAGVAIGVFGALAFTRLLSSLLYGVRSTDPFTFAGVAILLLLVALAACYIPARRAMRVDPMDALRYE